MEGGEGKLIFKRVSPPSDAEVTRVANHIHRRVVRFMKRRGLGYQSDPGETDTLWHDEPLLAELYSTAVSGRIATGPRAGRRIVREGDAEEVGDSTPTSGRCCAVVGGYSVHAGVCVPAHDRMRLERLARYAGRPPLSMERLSLLPDGRLLYRLKRSWRDGTTHVIYEPLELIERLAALVHPPRFNITRYSGVLAPAAAYRSMIIPRSKVQAPPAHAGCQAGADTGQSETVEARDPCGYRKRNYSWAQLMTRVFEFDVLACPRCGARMRILAAIDTPDAIRKILACLGFPTRAPPIAPAIPDGDAVALW